MALDPNITYPFGAADAQTLAYAATQNVTIKNRKTILILAILTGNCTINVAFATGIANADMIGADLLLVVPATSNGNDITLGTLIDGANIVGVAGKTKTQYFTFDGTSFKPAGGSTQID